MKIGACPCCCRPDLALTHEGVCFVCRDMIAHGLVEWREDGTFLRSEEALLRINDMRRDLGFSPLGGAGNTEEETMGKDKPKGTCRYCQRPDLTIQGKGGCGSCYGLIKSGDIDPETGTMTDKAKDKINELRAMSGMEPLPGREDAGETADAVQEEKAYDEGTVEDDLAEIEGLAAPDVEELSERRTCLDCRHASPAESRERCGKDRSCRPDETPGEYPGWEPVGEGDAQEVDLPGTTEPEVAMAIVQAKGAKDRSEAEEKELQAQRSKARASAGTAGLPGLMNDFLLDRCEFHPSYSVSAEELYAAFTAWWTGLHPALEAPSEKAFVNELRDRHFVSRKVACVRWDGLRLKTQIPEQCRVCLAWDATDRVCVEGQNPLAESCPRRETSASMDDRLLAEDKAKVLRDGLITSDSLEVNGQVLPLVRKGRGGQADTPYVLVNRGGKHLSLPKATLACLGREPEALRVYGQAGANVLALQITGKDDMEARPLCRKAKSTALIMYAETVIKDLGLSPGRYPVQILESGILAVDLAKRAA